MTTEIIDWEAAIKETQLAARAASRGSERVAAAIAEMNREQMSEAQSRSKFQAETKAELHRLTSIETALRQLNGQAQNTMNRLSSIERRTDPKVNPISYAAFLFAGIVLGVFSTNLF
ncbi:hypothetical protein ATO1_01865 [Phaeobacter sp. 22II1-1F12B]|nr:hypothetical protein ATO1_01865 [Phaeobacter sp. 22II1-1F12B]